MLCYLYTLLSTVDRFLTSKSFPCKFGLACEWNHKISFLFISIVFYHFKLFGIFHGHERCSIGRILFNLNWTIDWCRISEEINPFSTHIKENLSSFLLSSLTWLLCIDEESFQLWGRTMHLKKTRFSFQNNFPISEHEPRPHVLDRV